MKMTKTFMTPVWQHNFIQIDVYKNTKLNYNIVFN